MARGVEVRELVKRQILLYLSGLQRTELSRKNRIPAIIEAVRHAQKVARNTVIAQLHRLTKEKSVEAVVPEGTNRVSYRITEKGLKQIKECDIPEYVSVDDLIAYSDGNPIVIKGLAARIRSPDGLGHTFALGTLPFDYGLRAALEEAYKDFSTVIVDGEIVLCPKKRGG